MAQAKYYKSEIEKNYTIEEGKLGYDERRKLDQVRQVLSVSPNVYQDFQNIGDLFTVYGKVLNGRINDNFKESLIKSKECFENANNISKEVKSLKINDANSFLLVTLCSDDHMFGSIIRKTDEGYSITIVNKGGREPHRKQFEENIVPENKIDELFSEINRTRMKTTIESIYNIIKFYSDQTYKLNIAGRNQKTGNCFIKEPETAIKYAFATREFSREKLDSFRGFKPKEKQYKAKWDYSTNDTHGKFLENVRFENGKMSKLLNSEFEIYSSNKKFRQFMESGVGLDKSLIRAFDNEGMHSGLNYEDRMIMLISKLNLDSMGKYFKPLSSMIYEIGNDEQIKIHKKLMLFISHSGRESYFNYSDNYKQFNQFMEKAKGLYPTIIRQLKYDFHLGYFGQAIPHMMYGNFETAIENYDKGIGLYAYNPRPYYIKGICYLTIAEVKTVNDKKPEDPNVIKAVETLTQAIKVNEKYMEAYYMRGLAFDALEDKVNANKDYQKAKELNPELYKEMSEQHVEKLLKYVMDNEANKITFAVKSMNNKLNSRDVSKEFEKNMSQKKAEVERIRNVMLKKSEDRVKTVG